MKKGWEHLKNEALALAIPSIFALFSPFTFAVTYRNLRVWRTYLWASLIGNLGEPLLYLAAIGFGIGSLIGENGVYGIPYDVFLAPGILVSTCMYTATFETTFGSFTRMKPQKTFDAILVTPVNIAELATGEVYSSAMKSGLGALIVLCVISAFGLVKSPLAILTIPLGFLVGYAFGALGLVFTAIAPDYSFFNYFFTLVMAPMFLLSGIFFPVSVLPEWAQILANILPLTHAVNISRSLCLGTLSMSLLIHVFVLFLGGLVSTHVASVLLLRRLIP
jgi:lipooligosaccharide transport system permease protein